MSDTRCFKALLKHIDPPGCNSNMKIFSHIIPQSLLEAGRWVEGLARIRTIAELGREAFMEKEIIRGEWKEKGRWEKGLERKDQDENEKEKGFAMKEISRGYSGLVPQPSRLEALPWPPTYHVAFALDALAWDATALSTNRKSGWKLSSRTCS